MQIVNHGLRLNLERAHQVVERLAEEVEAGEVFKVAEMLALIDKTTAGQRKNILQMSADSEQRRGIEWQRHAERNESPCAANQLRSAVDNCRDRIVAALQDFAVVHQEGVGNAAEPRAGFVVIDGDGLFAQIGGGHHQTPGGAHRQREDGAGAHRAERGQARECPEQRRVRWGWARAARDKNDGARWR